MIISFTLSVFIYIIFLCLTNQKNLLQKGELEWKKKHFRNLALTIPYS